MEANKGWLLKPCVAGVGCKHLHYFVVEPAAPAEGLRVNTHHPRYRREAAHEGGGMVPDPSGQWVHVSDLGVEEWSLDALDAAPAEGLREALALADSMIRSGERHTPQSEAIIRAALTRPPAPAEGLREAARRVHEAFNSHDPVSPCYHSPENEWEPFCEELARAALAQPPAPAEGLRDEPVARLRRALDAHPNATYVRVEAIDLRAALDGEPR